MESTFKGVGVYSLILVKGIYLYIDFKNKTDCIMPVELYAKTLPQPSFVISSNLSFIIYVLYYSCFHMFFGKIATGIFKMFAIH